MSIFGRCSKIIKTSNSVMKFFDSLHFLNNALKMAGTYPKKMDITIDHRHTHIFNYNPLNLNFDLILRTHTAYFELSIKR